MLQAPSADLNEQEIGRLAFRLQKASCKCPNDKTVHLFSFSISSDQNKYYSIHNGILQAQND